MDDAGYEIAEDTRGPRREFRITVGLREGYDPEGRVYDVSEATKIALNWMSARAASDQPFLSGMVTRGEVAYASKDANGAVVRGREPVAMFIGEALAPHPGGAGALEDREIEALLTELATLLGRGLRQEHVFVAYRDRTWVVQRKGA